MTLLAHTAGCIQSRGCVHDRPVNNKLCKMSYSKQEQCDMIKCQLYRCRIHPNLSACGQHCLCTLVDGVEPPPIEHKHFTSMCLALQGEKVLKTCRIRTKTSRPQWCSGSSGPGSYLQRGSISWCVKEMSASLLVGPIFNGLYSFAQNNP